MTTASLSGGVPRPPARIAILSPGTSEFDSRAHRIARSLVGRGDTVTIYSRRRPGLPAEESVDGYRVVRMPLSAGDAAALRGSARDVDGPRPASRSIVARGRGALRRALGSARTLWLRWTDRVPVIHRFRMFPLRPYEWAGWFERGVEPHEVWHGMWAPSLPALHRVRARHGGVTLYDPRDVFLRSRIFSRMPAWQRALLTRFERHWARRADAVIQVSEPYAEMTARDLGLAPLPIVRNCPDRWDPPVPRPDRIRERLGLRSSTRIVLYQGLFVVDRGIEQAMDAILEVPDAVLVLMGFGNLVDHYRGLAASARYAGHVQVIDAVPPQDLLLWSASSDVMVMLYQPSTENHEFVTPQKLWEAMSAGVPVVASDLPGFRSIVPVVDCGVLVDPTDPAAVARGIRALLDLGDDGLRAVGDRGLRAAHETYNWETQFEVLDAVYARLLGRT
jgi:glycosyltransferase involved in cell wall biosynthesis